MRLALAITLLAVLTFSGRHPLAAQEQPAHLASCTTDSAARFFLIEVQYLLAGTDSAARARRAALSIGPVAPEEAQLVTEDQLCLDAARAAGLHPPYPLAIVRAGDRLLIRIPDRSHRTIEVFDLRLQRLALERGIP